VFAASSNKTLSISINAADQVLATSSKSRI
jgi:hypothetical protein